jgi:hypothetical protein
MPHAINRRSALGLPALLLAAPTQAKPPRHALRGSVTAANYPALASFVSGRLDGGPFGLDLFVPFASPGLAVEGADPLVIYRDDAFEAAQRGEEAIQLSAQSGFRRTAKGVYFGGLYGVEYAGLHQGITALFLKPVRTGQRIVDDLAKSPGLVSLE